MRSSIRQFRAAANCCRYCPEALLIFFAAVRTAEPSESESRSFLRVSFVSDLHICEDVSAVYLLDVLLRNGTSGPRTAGYPFHERARTCHGLR